MKVVNEVSVMQEISNYFRSTGKKIAFVPTMGYLHDGHISLMSDARRAGDVVVVSIFVNPTQFGKGEDFEKYPRDLQRDEQLCEDAGVDFIFSPDTEEMYRNASLTFVTVEEISSRLEGSFRPGHFRGVATVVAKLINIVKPHTMHMGSKDAQQNVVLKKMIADLNFETALVICPTIRESNGLAMSSRNAYLTEEERSNAGSLYKILLEGQKMITEDAVNDPSLIREKVSGILTELSPGIELQYYEITDNENLEPLNHPCDHEGEILISLAAKCGVARLIDNIIFVNKPVKNKQ